MVAAEGEEEHSLSDRSGGAKGGRQFVEGTLADRAGRVAEHEEDDGGQGHDTEDGPEPVRSMRGQVVVRIRLRFKEGQRSEPGGAISPLFGQSVRIRTGLSSRALLRLTRKLVTDSIAVGDLDVGSAEHVKVAERSDVDQAGYLAGRARTKR